MLLRAGTSRPPPRLAPARAQEGRRGGRGGRGGRVGEDDGTNSLEVMLRVQMRNAALKEEIRTEIAEMTERHVGVLRKLESALLSDLERYAGEDKFTVDNSGGQAQKECAEQFSKLEEDVAAIREKFRIEEHELGHWNTRNALEKSVHMEVQVFRALGVYAFFILVAGVAWEIFGANHPEYLRLLAYMTTMGGVFWATVGGAGGGSGFD